MKKRYSLIIKGKLKTWSFTVWEDPQYIEEWREDGIIIDELCYSIPVWVIDCGLMKPYVIFSDLFNFRNPFKNTLRNPNDNQT